MKAALAHGAGLPLMLLAMLSMVVLPLPAILLDGLFTFNICLSLIVILAVVYTCCDRWTSQPSRRCCCWPPCCAWP